MKIRTNIKLLPILSLMCVLLFLPANVSAASKVKLSLSCKHAVIMDADTGKIIYKKKAYSKCHNASTTKLMTAIVAVENNKKLNKKVRITNNAVKTGGKDLGIYSGEKYYLKDLLNAMLITSACDCSVAVAEGTSGNVKKFVKKMNKKAKKLGCKKTRFSTPSGLYTKSSHYTTAYDMSLITIYAYNNKTIRKMLSRKKYTFKSISGKKRSVETTNELLGSKNYKCIGKTGTGKTAKYCFTGIYKYKGHRYVVTALGSPDEDDRWSDIKKMIKACRSYTNEL